MNRKERRKEAKTLRSRLTVSRDGTVRVKGWVVGEMVPGWDAELQARLAPHRPMDSPRRAIRRLAQRFVDEGQTYESLLVSAISKVDDQPVEMIGPNDVDQDGIGASGYDVL